MILTHLALLIALPFLLIGVINRTKSLWSGRRGPPIFQLAQDVVRLLRKTAVYSHTTTPVFRIAPYVVLATALASSMVVPLSGQGAPAAFAYDFVWLAYTWGLGRVALMLGALDTGSAFEGMGAAREATYSALIEPALFLVAGALCLTTGERSLASALAEPLTGAAAPVVWLACTAALLVVVQVEAARVPVDDPSTHLELTMIHEVMILDHSGPELAALQLASAVKLTLGVSLIATLSNPWAVSDAPRLALLAQLVLCLVLAIVIGSIESLIARLRLRAIPQYVLGAVLAGVVALLATTWRTGGAG